MKFVAPVIGLTHPLLPRSAGTKFGGKSNPQQANFTNIKTLKNMLSGILRVDFKGLFETSV
jgi:tyrosyl-tRNA synthetase